MYDLPSEEPNEPGFPDHFHSLQTVLLSQTFHPPTYPADQFFVARNLYLYYDLTHPHWHISPDWFTVLGVSRLYQPTNEPRYSYVVWDEPVSPFLAVEILSAGSERDDLGQNLRANGWPPTKRQVYEQILHLPYYVVFDRFRNEIRWFKWVPPRYQELSLLNSQFWFDEIQLGLGLWKGKYDGFERQWLRWYDKDGRWIPTPVERAEQAEQRLLQLAAKLRALGIDPDQL
jgi:Uma2 family endonuclease